MRYPVDDFKTKWNMTAGYGFGDKTSYGYHEAIDINDNGGGDSDLGKPLYAIADGEVSSVHEHTGQNTFGKHVHVKIDGPWGTRYIHYAHCQDVFVKVGDKVIEGQKIATLGKSGTQYAHCHFACKKQPTGIDAIAKTLDELQMWEDPILFIESNLAQQTVDQQSLIDQLRADRDKNWTLYEQEQQAKILLEDAVSAKQKTIDALTKENLDLKTKLDSATTEKNSLSTSLQEVRRELDGKTVALSVCEDRLSNRKDLAKYTTKELILEIFGRFHV